MKQPRYAQMLSIIDEVFKTREDKGQIKVTSSQYKKLQLIHSFTLNELADELGPLIWVLLIPTTREVMQLFLDGKITEKSLLRRTRPGQHFNCLYLCSATTLPEIRHQGKTKALCLSAIEAMRKDFPLDTLYVWPFSEEGWQLAMEIARSCGMELRKKKTVDLTFYFLSSEEE